MFPKPKKPDPPPAYPTKADASVQLAGQNVNTGYSSLINTGPTGLTRKSPNAAKRSLIGGSS